MTATITGEQLAERAAQLLRQHFTAAGVNDTPDAWIRVHAGDYVGDGIAGHVECYGHTMYPVPTGDGRVGWGVDEAVVIPGRRTMSNGDPGYPDDVDVVTLVEALTTRQSILGPRVDTSSIHTACEFIVQRVVAWRLSLWRESLTSDEYVTDSHLGWVKP